ncbi:MAG: DUF2330 domain-containing protein [Myxococcota bacterium]|nr:DUF2330 domain-containing protein [Myxococcota bacterium]
MTRARITLAALVALALTPADAAACGGFFCSAAAPVNQAGEDIVYAVEDDGSLTMTIRIVYQGTAAEFAWILPVPVLPLDIAVGSEALFQSLAQATGPSFQSATRTDGVCRSEPACDYPMSSFGCAAESADAFPARGFADAAVGVSFDGGGVTVVREETVGPYETVVLSGGTAEELQTWLTDNGYDIPESSIPLMGEYVAARQLFVALRLRNGAMVSEIQPLVLRMAETQPCLPIRLTAIATVPDLPIAAYFLADAPAVPTNYSLLEPPANDLRLWNGSLLWTDHVSAAVDDAGGHAFVTDYAGDVPSLSLELPSVDDLATVTSTSTYARELQSRGYTADGGLASIIGRFVEPASMASCMAQGTTCGTATSFDPAGLTLAIDEQITQPRLDAQAMLARHSVLTRLFTTLSAEEMTLDPEFMIDAGVPMQSNVHTATTVTECGPEFFVSTAPQHIELPDGSRVVLTEGEPGVSDDQFCERRGGSVAGRGGCSASIGHVRGLPALLAIIGITIALTWRRRRRR